MEPGCKERKGGERKGGDRGAAADQTLPRLGCCRVGEARRIGSSRWRGGNPCTATPPHPPAPTSALDTPRLLSGERGFCEWGVCERGVCERWFFCEREVCARVVCERGVCEADFRWRVNLQPEGR